MMSIWNSFIWTMEWWGQVNARRSSQLKLQLMQMPNPDLCDTSALLLIISSSSFVGTCILWTNLMTSSPLAYRVVKSSRLLAKIAAYLVISIGWLLCLAFLYGWCFLNKISLDLVAYFDNSAIYTVPKNSLTTLLTSSNGQSTALVSQRSDSNPGKPEFFHDFFSQLHKLCLSLRWSSLYLFTLL